jgi:hypothetical protein
MLKCPVCGTENGDLDTICVSCKGFIQAKVDTLDLFRTFWGLLETPHRTFRRIALAKSKNYVLLLSAALGTALVFSYFWYWQMAVQIPNLLTLVGIGMLAGPPVGVLAVWIIGIGITTILKLGKTNLSARNCRAVFAYSALPLAATVLIVLFFEIGIFGPYFFDNNPPPMVINPVAYIGLLGIQAASGIWSFVLLVLGLRSASGTTWPGAVIAGCLGACVLALLVVAVAPV